MARDVTFHESVLLGKMVDYGRMLRKVRGNDEREDIIIDLILLLLDCIVDFRDGPQSTPVEDGCGAMVVKE